jgi:hypothetical protein
LASDEGPISVDDGGGSLTIDGTVAVSSSALPTGASTEAKQDAEIALLTTIDADTGSIDTKLVQQALNYGAAAGAVRVAAQIGNATAVADFGSGTVSSQTVRNTPASDSPHLLAARHEAAATPLAVRGTNGTAFDAYGTGVDSTNVPRRTLSTRHESLTTPLAVQLSNGGGGLAFGSGPDGADVLRVVLSQRQEAATAPLSARLSDGSAFYQAPTTAQIPATLGAKTSANSLSVVLASDQATVPTSVAITNLAATTNGKIAGASLTGSYATVVTTAQITRLVFVINSCDQTILVSLDGGATAAFELEAGESVSLDLATDGLRIASGVNLQAKHGGVTPTTGSVRITAIG